MRRSPVLVLDKPTNLVQQQPQVSVQQQNTSQKMAWLPFFCLVGFIATQGYLIPLISLPLNWAVWPSLADLFGIGLVLTVILSPRRAPMTMFDRGMVIDVVWLELFFLLNFLLVTIPFSSTGEGVKFGGFSLILFTKYVVVYWAAAHVPVDIRRRHILHAATLVALLWLIITTLADRFYLIEIDTFTSHLPRLTAGKWGVINLDSTVSATHGGTTVVILILCALLVGTASHRFAWFVKAIALILSIATCFIAGSRQGLVRMITFTVAYSAKSPAKFLALITIFFIPFVVIIWNELSSLQENSHYLEAVQRQEVLVTDPFSDEGLSGRPKLWRNVLETLNEEPIRWVIGYGLGNYVEYNNASHNMILRLLQDGGIIELIWVSIIWARILRRVWVMRRDMWAIMALTAGMLTSLLTSEIFYPTLATGWYLGLYFVTMHITFETENISDTRFQPMNS